MTTTVAPSTPAAADPGSQGSTLGHVRHVLSENPVTLLAAGLFVGFVLMALVGPWLVPYDPLASNASRALESPSAAHWFGTDALGRDIFSRVVVATRLDMGIAFAAVAMSFVIGMPLGLAAGFLGGWWDRIISRVADCASSGQVSSAARSDGVVADDRDVEVVKSAAGESWRVDAL